MNPKTIVLLLLLVSLGFVGVVSAQTVSPSTVLPNETNTFTFSNSFLNLTSPANYTWNFGDNTTEVVTSTPVVSHTYVLNGTYTLSVNVTAIPFAGSAWNVSSDWQQPLGVYSTSVLVLTVTPPVSDDGTMGIAVVALLMAFALPIVFFVMKKNSSNET
jgi:hypothetical protein